ncbi:hypothetical protein VXE65_32740 [Mycolicibacterium conceptionense]|uniref:hypothetical protein n=1 Tax=Mycolicibacterium conceptionense TaxID=451644 RepID=UPI003204B9CA
MTTTDKTVEKRDALKRRLADIRMQIEVAQRAPVDPRVTAAAIEQARRDQDALTSPVLEDLRETAERLAVDIEHAWISLCRTTSMADTLAAKAPTVTVPSSLPAAITAAAAIRDQLTEELAAADIDTIELPALPPHSHLNPEDTHGTR